MDPPFIFSMCNLSKSYSKACDERFITDRQYLIAEQANQHARYHHLSKDNDRVHVFKPLAIIDQRLMVAYVFLESLVQHLHVFCRQPRFPIFLGNFAIGVAQFRESVLQYIKLAGQMNGQDAENVVETKVAEADAIYR